MTVHYLNRGTKYHVGDDNYGGSVDKEFIDAYPVVGQAWAQPFSVSTDDSVEVHIEHLWGVDFGNDNRVFINDQDIGEIRGEHNRGSWTSPSSWRLTGGKTYMLRIVSRLGGLGGPGDADDFVFEGVVVRTAGGAAAKPEGPPKVLLHPDDDYWSSTYDTGTAVAQSVEIERFWYVSDEASPGFRTNFKTHGLQGVSLKVCVFIFFKDGSPVANSGDAKYITPDGKLTVQLEVTPGYTHTSFTDIGLNIPFSQFIKGRHDYTARLEIHRNKESLGALDLESTFWVKRG